MKVLLVNHTLDWYAGSETFTYALAVELRRQGHEPVCFSPKLGALAKHLIAEGFYVTDDVGALPDDIEMIHSHHRYESLLARARFPNTPMIMVCHGIIPWQEQPLKADINIFRYIAVSEEVKTNLEATCSIDPRRIDVIPNGVDLKRFHARKPLAPVPRRALILSHNMLEEQRSVIRSACRRLSIDLTSVGRPAPPVWDVEDAINQADVVFSIGRGALEAMACMRAVIVCGYSGADGLVTPENFHMLARKNFSGRTGRLQYREADVLAEVERYDPSIPAQLLPYVTEEHSISGMTSRYLQLYRGAIEEAQSHSGRLTLLGHEVLREVLGEAEAEKLTRQEVQGRLQQTTREAHELQGELAHARRQLAQLCHELTRAQNFADAVRRTLAYKVYTKLVRPFRRALSGAKAMISPAALFGIRRRRNAGDAAACATSSTSRKPATTEQVSNSPK